MDLLLNQFTTLDDYNYYKYILILILMIHQTIYFDSFHVNKKSSTNYIIFLKLLSYHLLHNVVIFFSVDLLIFDIIAVNFSKVTIPQQFGFINCYHRVFATGEKRTNKTYFFVCMQTQGCYKAHPLLICPREL